VKSEVAVAIGPDGAGSIRSAAATDGLATKSGRRFLVAWRFPARHAPILGSVPGPISSNWAFVPNAPPATQARPQQPPDGFRVGPSKFAAVSRSVSLRLVRHRTKSGAQFQARSEIGMDLGAHWRYFVPPEVRGGGRLGGHHHGDRVLAWIGAALRMRHHLPLMSGQDGEGWGARGG
jgi:hypothetical protein